MLKSNPIKMLVSRETPFLNRLIMMSAVLACLFALLVAVALVSYGAQKLPEPVLPAAGVLSVSEYRSVASANDTTAMRERPVFWSERSPYVAPKPKKKKPVVKAPKKNTNIDDMTLLGVFSAGSESSVTVSYKDKTHHLRVDEELAGWTLLMVSAQGAHFGETDTLDGELVSRLISIDHGPSLPTKWQGGDVFKGDQN